MQAEDTIGQVTSVKHTHRGQEGIESMGYRNITIEAYHMKVIVFKLLLIVKHHSETTSRFASSMWEWTTGDDNPELEPPRDHENFSFQFDHAASHLGIYSPNNHHSGQRVYKVVQWYGRSGSL